MIAHRTAGWLAGLALVATAACQLEPDVGPPLAGACADTDTLPGVKVSFSRNIRPIIARPFTQPGCSCHLPSAASAGPATQITGLDLSSIASLRDGGHNSGAQIVVPFQPCASIMYQKVSEAPPFGSRMPLGGPPYLTEDEIALIHDWIAEGALDN